jgi:hypothetical protein
MYFSAVQYPVLEQTTSKTIEKPHTAEFRQAIEVAKRANVLDVLLSG